MLLQQLLCCLRAFLWDAKYFLILSWDPIWLEYFLFQQFQAQLSFVVYSCLICQSAVVGQVLLATWRIDQGFHGRIHAFLIYLLNHRLTLFWWQALLWLDRCPDWIIWVFWVKLFIVQTELWLLRRTWWLRRSWFFFWVVIFFCLDSIVTTVSNRATLTRTLQLGRCCIIVSVDSYQVLDSLVS